MKLHSFVWTWSSESYEKCTVLLEKGASAKDKLKEPSIQKKTVEEQMEKFTFGNQVGWHSPALVLLVKALT